MRTQPQLSSDTSAPSISLFALFTTWWLRLTSNERHAPDATLAQRELKRRSRLVSWLILGLYGGVVILSPLAVSDLRARITLVSWIIGITLAALLNRRGWVTASGVLLVVIISGGLLEANLASPIGLTMGELPNFDAYVVSVVFAATVLPRWSTFVVAAINSALISGDYLLQPHNANIQHDALLYSSVTSQTISLLVRPIALQFVLALVAFLWIRSTSNAIKRADKAEEIVILQQRELDRTRALEEGIRQLLATHVEVANGNFAARVPAMRDPMLWQVGVSLNLLIRRLQTFIGQNPPGEQFDYNSWLLQRTVQDAERLVAAIRQAQRGIPPEWPELSGAPLDNIIVLLQESIDPYHHSSPRGGYPLQRPDRSQH